MKVIKGNRIVFFDLDDTIIHWIPVKTAESIDIKYENSDIVHTVTVIQENMDALKIHKSRNHTIVVWSAGGWQWAEAVVKALKLEDYVDLVICKPSWIYDDLDPANFMPKPLWGVRDPGQQYLDPNKLLDIIKNKDDNDE